MKPMVVWHLASTEPTIAACGGTVFPGWGKQAPMNDYEIPMHLSDHGGRLCRECFSRRELELRNEYNEVTLLRQESVFIPDETKKFHAICSKGISNIWHLADSIGLAYCMRPISEEDRVGGELLTSNQIALSIPLGRTWCPFCLLWAQP
jgi:hypothetical protein